MNRKNGNGQSLHGYCFPAEMSDELVIQALAAIKVEPREIVRKADSEPIVWIVSRHDQDEISHVLNRWAFWNGPPID